MQRPTDTNGFTLVELAVSLVVIGLLIGLGTAMVGPLMTSIKVRESRENLGAAVESINGWAAGNNRLPDATEFGSTVRTPTDAWGRDFIYLYDNNLASGTITKDTICGRRSTSIILTDSNTTASISNVAYVILSSGDDAAVQSTLITTTGPPVVAATLNGTASGPTIVAGTRGYITGTVVANTSEDIVRWVTLDELRTKVGCQGAQLKITTNELPYGYNNAAYGSNIYADGGVPFASGGKYSWCIQANADATSQPTITFKSTGGTSIPIKVSCSSGVAVQSDSLVIGGAPVIPVVTGTDSKIYSCLQGHVAATANKPITGATYSQYWQLITSGATNTTWASGVYYPCSSNNISVFSYDSAGNSANKPFVFTINP